MTIRKLIYLPDPRLRRVTENVEHFDNDLHALIDDMFETMYAANGVGLAAPQIGINLNLAVIDVNQEKKQQIVLANPKILASHGEVAYQEGCLSVPGAYDTVLRAEEVTVQAQDRLGKTFTITAKGLLCECLQHEIDHLNGKLFVDLLSPLKRALARKKMDKYQRSKARKA